MKEAIIYHHGQFTKTPRALSKQQIPNTPQHPWTQKTLYRQTKQLFNFFTIYLLNFQCVPAYVWNVENIMWLSSQFVVQHYIKSVLIGLIDRKDFWQLNFEFSPKRLLMITFSCDPARVKGLTIVFGSINVGIWPHNIFLDFELVNISY